MNAEFKSGLPIQKVGIALAAYRPQILTFAEQLRSIQAQTFKDWVCAITCDSPLEEIVSCDAIKPFQMDSRFQWIENPIRLGHKKNFEKAIQICANQAVEAIACSDQDDIWYPNKLEIGVKALESAGPASLVHSDMHVLDGTRTLPLTAWQIEHRGVQNSKPSHLMIRNIVAGCSMLFDANLARQFRTIPDEAEYHDHWYALIAASQGGVHCIHEPLYAYRQHASNVVGVTPFKSVFGLPQRLSPQEIIKKCRRGWHKSSALAQAARREGIPVSRFQLGLILNPLDCGLGVLFLGLRHIVDDRPLLRACLARGAGKAFDFFARRGHDPWR